MVWIANEFQQESPTADPEPVASVAPAPTRAPVLLTRSTTQGPVCSNGFWEPLGDGSVVVGEPTSWLLEMPNCHHDELPTKGSCPSRT